MCVLKTCIIHSMYMYVRTYVHAYVHVIATHFVDDVVFCRLGGNKFNDEGVKILCAALMHENSTATKIQYVFNHRLILSTCSIMYLCMYVCSYMFICMYMYVRMCSYIYVYNYVCMHECLVASMYICLYVRMYELHCLLFVAFLIVS